MLLFKFGKYFIVFLQLFHSLTFQLDLKLVKSCRTAIKGDGRYLIIEDVDLEDAGKYVCTASNLVGVASKRFEVEVRGTILAYLNNPLIIYLCFIYY